MELKKDGVARTTIAFERGRAPGTARPSARCSSAETSLMNCEVVVESVNLVNNLMVKDCLTDVSGTTSINKRHLVPRKKSSTFTRRGRLVGIRVPRASERSTSGCAAVLYETATLTC